MKPPVHHALALAALLLLAHAAANAQARARFELLPTLGGSSSSATALNDLGQVVGSAADVNGLSHAFIWQPGAGIRALGDMGAFASQATGINAGGQVVGSGRSCDDINDAGAVVGAASHLGGSRLAAAR